MQSINELEADTGSLLDADTLRGMTITKEDIYLRQKNEVLDGLMSSMVSNATANGVFGYSASLHKDFNVDMLKEILEEFNKVGYNATYEENNSPAMGEHLTIHVSWETEDVSS